MAGSSDGTVEVRITGSVDGSLAASTAQASASVKAMSSEMTAAAATTTALATATKAEAAATQVATAAHTNARAVTESLAAVHEIMQGRTSRLGGTLMILAQAATGASTGMLVMGAAVAGAALGLGYLAYQEYEAEKKAEGLAEGFAITGRGAMMTTAAVEAEIEMLRQLPNVTRKIATAIVEWEAAHGEIDNRINQAVDQLLPQYAQWLGEKAPEAIGKLKETLQGIATDALPKASEQFDKLNASVLHLAEPQKEMILNLLESGERTKALDQIIGALASNAGAHIESLNAKIKDLSAQLSAAHADVDMVKNSMVLGADEGGGYAFALGQAEDRVRKLENALKLLNAELKQQASATPAQLPLSGLERYEGKLKEQASLVHDTAAQRHVDEALIEAATAKLKDQNLAEQQIVTSAQQARQILGQQADAIAKSAAAGYVDKSGPRQAAQLSREGELEKVAAVREAGAEIISADRGTQAERLASVKKLWDDFKKGESLTASEINQVNKEAAAQASEINKQAASNQIAIDRSDASTAVEIAKIELQTKKDNLQAEVDAGTITKQQKIALEEQYTAAAEALDIQLLTAKIHSGDETVVAAADDANKIKVIQAQAAAEIAAINRQGADQTASAWQRADQEILSSENTLVSNILHGRQTLGLSMLQFVGQMVEQELQADLRLWTEKALIAVVGQGKIKATEQGGFLYDLLFDRQEVTQATATEAAKTSAVVAGVAAQTAAKQAGATEGLAAQAIAGSAAILNDAYQAAAATYSSVAQIPYIGWILAPAAAGVAFAAVMAFDSMTSAEGGDYNVRAGLYNLHDEEAVIPRQIANPMRTFFESGAAGNYTGGATYGGDTNFHLYNQTTVNSSDPMHAGAVRKMWGSQGAMIMDMIQNGYRPGMPMRPSMRTV